MAYDRPVQGQSHRAARHGQPVQAFDTFAGQVLRKLVMLEFAHVLSDLRAPPGNQLEALSGDRKGQYSIRINRQWRLCFV